MTLGLLRVAAIELQFELLGYGIFYMLCKLCKPDKKNM
jgi:hypothetical protein